MAKKTGKKTSRKPVVRKKGSYAVREWNGAPTARIPVKSLGVTPGETVWIKFGKSTIEISAEASGRAEPRKVCANGSQHFVYLPLRDYKVKIGAFLTPSVGKDTIRIDAARREGT